MPRHFSFSLIKIQIKWMHLRIINRYTKTIWQPTIFKLIGPCILPHILKGSKIKVHKLDVWIYGHQLQWPLILLSLCSNVKLQADRMEPKSNRELQKGRSKHKRNKNLGLVITLAYICLFFLIPLAFEENWSFSLISRHRMFRMFSSV